MTIKIISTKGPSEANLQAVEREELVLAAAKMMATSLGSADPADVQRCASKIRSTHAAAEKSVMDRLATDISARLTGTNVSIKLLDSTELDIDRVMKLLEG